MSWDQLRKHALLGTEKYPLHDTSLVDELRAHLVVVSKSEQEDYFLTALSLASLYELGGTAPYEKVDNVAQNNISPQETQPYCSPISSTAWRKIEPHKAKNIFLVELWLQKNIDNQWIISPDIIVPLLQLGATKKGETLRSRIAEVVGIRGRWLATHYPKWNFVFPQDNVKLFREGKSNERLMALRNLRRHTPNMALLLLKETWAKESSKERQVFLETLSLNFSESEQDTINTWQQELTQSPNYHPTENEQLLNPFQSKESLEQVLMTHPNLIFRIDWNSLPLYFDWSLSFSVFILRIVYESFYHYYFPRATNLTPWIAHLHVDVSASIVFHESHTYQQKNAWEEFFNKEILKVIEIKRLIGKI